MAAAALAVGLAAGAEAQTRARAVPQANDPYFVAAAERLARTPMHERRRAKNVILFVGDGMGVTTVTAARIYAGQARGVDGESYELAMDSLPRTGLSHTYSHDFQVADSAATVTAMTSGVKTRSGAINVTSDVPLGDCAAMEGHVARTLFEIAEERGLATGVISTARLTHATPAGVYAHTPHRDWENDTQAKDGCVDIARQLVEWQAGDGLEVALGGGRANFLPTTMSGTPNNSPRRISRARRACSGSSSRRTCSTN
jgi:alkaline phosphatase